MARDGQWLWTRRGMGAPPPPDYAVSGRRPGGRRPAGRVGDVSRTLLPTPGGARRTEALLWRWALLLALAGLCLSLSLIGLGAGVFALALAAARALAAAAARASRPWTPFGSLAPVARGEAPARVRPGPALPAAPRL